MCSRASNGTRFSIRDKLLNRGINVSQNMTLLLQPSVQVKILNSIVSGPRIRVPRATKHKDIRTALSRGSNSSVVDTCDSRQKSVPVRKSTIEHLVEAVANCAIHTFNSTIRMMGV